LKRLETREAFTADPAGARMIRMRPRKAVIPLKADVERQTWNGRVDLVGPGHLDIRWSIVSAFRRCWSANAAVAPRYAASSAPAAAAPASPAASAASATSAAAASAAPGELGGASGRACVLLVEEMERGQTDVGDFFFAERDGLAR
jgi:hypothetical protein